MMSTEQKLREAAAAFAVAARDATAAGLSFQWPVSVDGLDRLAISQTGNASDEKPAPRTPRKK